MAASDPSDTSFWRIPDDIDKIEQSIAQSPSSEILASKLKNDSTMLENGFFADCNVICGDRTWKAHKVILSRCPYFAKAFASSSGFKVLLQEAIESKITIENFEPFEVSWLLQYIYGLQISAEQFRSTSPSKSFIETCALLWGIGDFFQLPDLTQAVLSQLQSRCRVFLLQSRCASTMLKEIAFLPDLEAGVRAAWRLDRVASPVRKYIISVCVSIHPFVKDHASFISLLDEMPEFTAQYVKALLGCSGMQSTESYAKRSRGVVCNRCGDCTLSSDGLPVYDEVFSWTPTSLSFWDGRSYRFCSKACYNYAVDNWVFPGHREFF